MSTKDATCRKPKSSDSRGTESPPSPVAARPNSIAAALDTAGPIDVLVNNPGIGLVGACEATPMAQARKVFKTNTFGVMAMTQAVAPQMRARRSGTIVNVTSCVALAPRPCACRQRRVGAAFANRPVRRGGLGCRALR